MLEERIIKLCAPTLAGLKTGNLFNSCGIPKNQLEKEIAIFRKILAPMGLELRLFPKEDRNPLVYLYRQRHLQRDLSAPEVFAFLQNYGYTAAEPEQALQRLAERIEECEHFPHEIGLFLSYPLEDVKGFIQFGSKCCKCSGYWCVYTDEQKARHAFARFDRCRNCYDRLYARGRRLEQLALAIPS